MYRLVLDLSEVWALIFPLSIFFYKNRKGKYITSIVIYLFAALVLNTAADIIQKISNPSLPIFLRYNNWLYNIHSIVRTVLFLSFFNLAIDKSNWFSAKLFVILFALAVFINFYKYENFFYFKSSLFALEGIVLLVCCVSFFLQRLKEDELYLDFDVPLIITTGLTIYEGINFFIFLFYDVLIDKEKNFAINIWDVHNISFIVFCVFIAYAFYGSPKPVQEI